MITSTSNAWIDGDVTKAWVDGVLGAFCFRRRLLVWDTYETHLMPSVDSSLKVKKIDPEFILGGCTKYIQARMYVGIIHLSSIVGNNMVNGCPKKAYSLPMWKCGNIKPPPRRTIVQWILESWNKLSSEMIGNSFVSCGLTGSFDGREIRCFKEGQSCYAGLQTLKDRLEIINSEEEDPFQVTEDDILDAAPDYLIIDENLTDDDDDIVVCNIKMIHCYS